MTGRSGRDLDRDDPLVASDLPRPAFQSATGGSCKGEHMSPASDGEPFSAGVPPYPAPGRREQRAPAHHMSVSSIVVITVCALVTIAVVFGGLALYLVAATESFEP